MCGTVFEILGMLFVLVFDGNMIFVFEKFTTCDHLPVQHCYCCMGMGARSIISSQCKDASTSARKGNLLCGG
jgi:hypothetical protein